MTKEVVVRLKVTVNKALIKNLEEKVPKFEVKLKNGRVLVVEKKGKKPTTFKAYDRYSKKLVVSPIRRLPLAGSRNSAKPEIICIMLVDEDGPDADGEGIEVPCDFDEDGPDV